MSCRAILGFIQLKRKKKSSSDILVKFLKNPLVLSVNRSFNNPVLFSFKYLLLLRYNSDDHHSRFFFFVFFSNSLLKIIKYAAHSTVSESESDMFTCI